MKYSRGENKLKQPKFVGQNERKRYIIIHEKHDNFGTNRSSSQRNGKSRALGLGCFTCPLNALTQARTHMLGGHYTFIDRKKALTPKDTHRYTI